MRRLRYLRTCARRPTWPTSGSTPCSTAARRARASPSPTARGSGRCAQWATWPTSSRRTSWRTLPGTRRHRPHPLLHRRRELDRQCPAAAHRLRARPGRHLPQRQPRQRPRAARRARSGRGRSSRPPPTPRYPPSDRASSAGSVVDALVEAMLAGHRRLLARFLSRERLVAVRDPHGFRPLSLGRLAGGWVVCDRDLRVRSLGRGHRSATSSAARCVIIGRRRRPQSVQPFAAGAVRRPAPSSTSTSRAPTATSSAQSSGRARQRLGRAARRESSRPTPTSSCRFPTPASAPPSATPRQSGVPLRDRARPQPLRRPHLHRAVAADPALRRAGEAQPGAQRCSQGKRIVLIDDSHRPRHDQPQDRPDVPRRRRQGGPPADLVPADDLALLLRRSIRRTREELIASSKSVEEIRRFVGADSLGYLSLEGCCSVDRSGSRRYCTACWTGQYPVAPIERRARTAQACELVAPRLRGRPPECRRGEGWSRMSTDDGLTYRDAGVDIDAGERGRPPHQGDAPGRRTRRASWPTSARSAGCSRSTRRGCASRCWSPRADGVGTKLKVAFMTGVHDTVGARPRQPLRQRHPRPGGDAALLPRLRGDRAARRPDVAGRSSRHRRRRAARTAARCSAARPPRCRASTPTASTTSPASSSGWCDKREDRRRPADRRPGTC